jgi:FKBP-type peptidyl-prolyl cis-trans isomerase SlyD
MRVAPAGPEGWFIPMIVQDGMCVGIDYTLRLDSGEVIDSSEGRGPLEFVQGHSHIIPGLERALYGMALGDEKDVVVAPAEGYGEFDSELLETLPLSVFPSDIELEEGMGLRMRTQDGRAVVVYVRSANDEGVVVDLNHPLAGKTLHFGVRIARLREASEDELAGGCGGGGGNHEEEEG